MKTFSAIATGGVLFAVSVFSAPASAADLPTRKAPMMVAPVAYNWTGFYVGLQAGWMGGAKDRVGVFDYRWRLANVGDLGVRGAFVGLRLGYDWQAAGSPFVFGVVGDVNADSAKRSLTTTLLPGEWAYGRSKVAWDASLRLRAGYAWDRLLVYGSAGVALVDNKYSLTIPDVDGRNTKNRTYVGGAIGVGVAYAITNNLSVGLDYRFTGVGKQLASGRYNAGPYYTRPSPHFHRVAATLDWRF